MNSQFINKVKSSRFLYGLYYFVMSGILKVFSVFLKSKHNAILFVCYGGRQYSCNVKAIYEAMLEDKRFSDMVFIWAFKNPKEMKLPDNQRTIKIQIDSMKYFINAIQCDYWLTNVTIQRGLSFKRKDQFYINTWHGFPFKFIGKDIRDDFTFKVKKNEQFDLFLSDGMVDKIILSNAFDVNRCVVTGYPRNDQMFSFTRKYLDDLKELYNIPKGKKIILYAPTYRDYAKDSNSNYIFNLDFDFDSFLQRFENRYILLFRSHCSIEEKADIPSGVIDVSSYPNVEDLLALSDILISDYSGVIPDFAILKKPVICYWADYDLYEKNRGLYYDVVKRMPFKKARSFSELCEILENLDYDSECNNSELFVNNCGILSNGSTKRAIDVIYDSIKKEIK